MSRWPEYVWTVFGGVWFGIWMTLGDVRALLVCVGCLAVAGLMLILEETI